MAMSEASVVALAIAAALHAGFQFTVTTVVYPALVAVEPKQWTQAHAAHGRAIAPIVGAIYGALLVAVVWAASSQPSNAWVWICVVGAAISMSTTAFVAGPTHGRLTTQPEPALLRRLIVSDRARSLGALVALVGGLLAALA